MNLIIKTEILNSKSIIKIGGKRMNRGEEFQIPNCSLLTLSSNNAAHFTASLFPLFMPVAKSKLLAVLLLLLIIIIIIR